MENAIDPSLLSFFFQFLLQRAGSLVIINSVTRGFPVYAATLAGLGFLVAMRCDCIGYEVGIAAAVILKSAMLLHDEIVGWEKMVRVAGDVADGERGRGGGGDD